MLKDEEARKGDMLKHLSTQEKEGSLEAKRLNEKIQLITGKKRKTPLHFSLLNTVSIFRRSH